MEFAQAIDVPGKPASEDPDEWLFEPVETKVAAHHVLLMNTLDKVLTGEIQNLMVFMPPGSAKSSYCSVVFPTYAMGKVPGTRVILGSYASSIAWKQSRRSRQIAKSAKFQPIFNAALVHGNQSVEEWGMDNGSEYMAGGILAGMTGNRASILIVDDPVSGREDAESDTIRKKTQEAYQDDLMTRLIPGGKQIIVQTRWHEADLSGAILPEGWAGESGFMKCRDGQRWFVLCLPAICDRADDPLGRKIGDPLWPEWFTGDHFVKFQSNPRTWSALFQQKPSPSGGGIIKTDQFRLWPASKSIPDLFWVGQSLDTAFTEKTTGDPTAFTCWGIFEYENRRNVLLLDCWDEHLGYPKLKERVIADWSARYGGEKDNVMKPSRRPDIMIIENKGSGQSLIQDLRQSNIPVVPYNPGKADKLSRVHMVTPLLASGCIWVLESNKNPGKPRTWAKPFLDQCEKFPVGAHDDYVDTFTQMMIYLKDTQQLEVVSAPDEEPDEVDYDQRKQNRVNPYG